jgi:hypothetical protein
MQVAALVALMAAPPADPREDARRQDHRFGDEDDGRAELFRGAREPLGHGRAGHAETLRNRKVIGVVATALKHEVIVLGQVRATVAAGAVHAIRRAERPRP